MKYLLSLLLLVFGLSEATLEGHIGLSAREKSLITHVKKSIKNAESGESKIDKSVLEIKGMSSPIVRHFLNNLCTLPNASYMEIGVWRGSTLISAIFNNENYFANAIAIENFSQFTESVMTAENVVVEQVQRDFYANINKYKMPKSFKFFNEDCFRMDLKKIKEIPINIYFYDGDHSSENHEKAFTYFNEVFDDVFIAIVDDWNWTNVQESTKRAFNKLNYTILFERSFITEGNGVLNSWWNGMYIAVIRKNRN